ncbi:MAG: MFS transporter [Patescibacteria group bacterium]
MKHHPRVKSSVALYTISAIGFIVSLHAAIPSYFNSSFLASISSEKAVSIIYLIVSFITILGLLAMNNIVRKIGNLRTALLLIIIQIAVFYGLISSYSPRIMIVLLILGMCIVSLISFTLDIFLQKNTDMGHTGGIRGLYMTVNNFAWVLSPLIGGMLILGNNYKGVYIAGFVLLLPMLYLVYKNFNNFKDSHYLQISFINTFIEILKDRDISKIFIINISLQTFYAWMVVYTPIYLHNVIGFNWTEISIIFTIMLLPFVFIEFPLGKLADKKWGEKEMLTIGFIIMGISTGSLFLFPEKSLLIWTIMLFITRVGAAIAEVMIETYFFKKVDDKNPEILGMFRITRPISYFIAPIITIVGLTYITNPYLFLILGILCLLTLYPILTIKDTN